MAIDHVNLGRLDLNLLVSLDALIPERGVTRERRLETGR